MALPPRDNEAFLREVDEELRRDQMRSFAQRYGMLLAVAVVLFLAAVGGYLWWQHHRQTVAGGHAEEFAAVLQDAEANRLKANDPRLVKLLEGGNAAQRAQASMLKAGLAGVEGRVPEAIATFGRLAADGNVPQVYRDAALVRQTALEYDKLKPDQVVARMKPIAVQGNAWFGSAGEMLALSYLQQGKTQLATPIFVALAKDEQVPTTIRARANEMALSLGADPGLSSQANNAGAAKEANR